MTTIDQARRRSTDEILQETMNETGDRDAQRAQGAGQTLHFDPFGGFDVHRRNERPTNTDAAATTVVVLGAKGVGAGVDKLVDVAVDRLAEFAGARAALGVLSLGSASVGMLHELYSHQIEGANREADKRRNLAASDAGVVGLANALPFDDGFKAVVSRTHPGAADAAAAMKARLQSPEHAADLEALRARSEKGIVDAAPVARATAKELVALRSNIDTDLATAKRLRAEGRPEQAVAYEKAAGALLERVDRSLQAYVAQFPTAHADAAYGLGVQYALHHAVRAEVGKETFVEFNQMVDRAKSHVVAVEPSLVQVRG